MSRLTEDQLDDVSGETETDSAQLFSPTGPECSIGVVTATDTPERPEDEVDDGVSLHEAQSREQEAVGGLFRLPPPPFTLSAVSSVKVVFLEPNFCDSTFISCLIFLKDDVKQKAGPTVYFSTV